MILPADDFAPWYGLFETLRVVAGRPIFCDEHRATLTVAAQTLALAPDWELIELARDQLPAQDGRWRWIVTRTGTETRFQAETFPPLDSMPLTLSPVRVGSQNWDARFKTLSYLAQAQARQLAGEGQALLTNEYGQIAGAAGGNLFWRNGSEVFTAALEAGCRAGVVRGWVQRMIPVTAGLYLIEDLERADEIFWTNSLRGIVSINEFRGRKFTDFSQADLLRRLYEWELVGKSVG